MRDPSGDLAAAQTGGVSFSQCLPDLLDVPQRDESPAFARSLDDLGLGVKALGEVLVAAAIATGTHLRVALVLQHAVKTL